MALPPAPPLYNYRDQDVIRQILNQGLADTVNRILALEAAPVIVPPPPVGVALRVGAFALDDITKGPGGDTAPPLYKAYVYLPQPTNPTAVIAAIDYARANGITIFSNFARARGGWVDVDPVTKCKNFNWSKYETKVRQFTVAGGATALLASKVTGALADRTMVNYVVDEPFLSDFCGTMPQSVQNDMGLLHKAIWPGSITCMRSSAQFMEPGPAPYTSVVTGGTVSGWGGIDYGWAQFVSQHVPSAGKTPLQFFADERNRLLALNCGVIPGLNTWSGGHYTDLAGVPACWDYALNGSSSGLVKGSLAAGDPSGTIYACASRPATETRFIANPGLIRLCAQAAVDSPYAAEFPAFMFWSNLGAGSDPVDVAAFTTYHVRSDYTSAYDDSINIGATRLLSNGWRTAK